MKTLSQHGLLDDLVGLAVGPRLLRVGLAVRPRFHALGYRRPVHRREAEVVLLDNRPARSIAVSLCGPERPKIGPETTHDLV